MTVDKLKHPSFTQPSDTDIRVWRYMDLSKLIDIISRKSLFLSRLDLLGDTHEGSITKATYLHRQAEFEKHGVANIIPSMSHNNKKINKSIYVNCWYFDNHESEAMWKLYCPENKGIAIQTTYKKLVQSVENDDYLYIGLIEYVDYDKDWFSNGNLFEPIMHKRKAFEFEKEVRLVKTDSNYWNENSPESPPGIYCPWDLIKFAESIYVNPYTENWYYEVVKDVLDKYDCNIDINWSTIKGIPYY